MTQLTYSIRLRTHSSVRFVCLHEENAFLLSPFLKSPLQSLDSKVSVLHIVIQVYMYFIVLVQMGSINKEESFRFWWKMLFIKRCLRQGTTGHWRIVPTCGTGWQKQGYAENKDYFKIWQLEWMHMENRNMFDTMYMYMGDQGYWQNSSNTVMEINS